MSESSYDVILFPAIAVVLACLFQGRYSTTLVLLAGAFLMVQFLIGDSYPLAGSGEAWLSAVQSSRESCLRHET